MRHLALLGSVGGVLICSWALATAQSPEQVSPDRVNALMEKLASSKFAERERAMKELEACGPAALPTLRVGLQSSDTEVRQRVEMLVRKLEDQQLAAVQAAGKKVRLQLKDVALRQAVAELSKQSGYPLELTAEAGADAARKVTLDTGDTTFWDALRQLCAKANLVETSAAPMGPGLPRDAKARVEEMWKEVNRAFVPGNESTTLSLTLTLGKPADLPTCYAGSIRIRLLKTTVTPAGEIDLLLEVMGEPRLAGFADAGALRINKAHDDKGQAWTNVGVPAAAANPPPVIFGPNGVVQGGFGGFGPGFGNGQFGAAGAVQGFKTFQVTVRLQRGDKAATKLHELSGKLAVKTTVETEPAIVVDKILDAAGQNVKSKDGRSLTVSKVQRLGNGDVRVEVAIEETAGQNPLGVGGPVRIQAVNKVVVNNGNNIIVINGGGLPSLASQLRLQDAKGDRFTQIETLASGVTFNGGRVAQTETVVFRPKPGQGAAARLVLPGQRDFFFDVPFSLKDIVLP